MFAVAFAAPVVLYDTDASRALKRLRRHTGETAQDTRALAELVPDGPPRLLGVPSLARCSGGPTQNEQLLRLLREAEELRLAMRADDWQRSLHTARETWACLGQPADASLGARLHFLLGIAAMADSDEAGAREAFATALRSDPQLAWDTDFAPDARPVFEQVRAEPTEPVVLTVVPHDAVGFVRADGRSLPLEHGQVRLDAGPHLLQLADASFWAAPQTDRWLLVPAAVPVDLLDRLDTPSGRDTVRALAEDAGLPSVRVPRSQRTWVLEQGAWSQRHTPLTRRMALPLVVSGAAVTVGGLVWALVEQQGAQRRLDAHDPQLGTDAYEASVQAHRAGRTRWAAGLGVSALGGVMTGFGLTFAAVRL